MGSALQLFQLIPVFAWRLVSKEPDKAHQPRVRLLNPGADKK